MNITHNEDSSLDIEHKWYGGACFFNMRKSHDELGTTRFEFVFDEEDIAQLIDYLNYALATKE